MGSGSPSPACQLAKASCYFRRLTKISDNSRKCSDLFRSLPSRFSLHISTLYRLHPCERSGKCVTLPYYESTPGKLSRDEYYITLSHSIFTELLSCLVILISSAVISQWIYRRTNLNSLFCCFFLLSDQVWVVDIIAVCYKAKLLSPVSLLLLSFSFTFSFMFGFWKRHLLEGALQAQYRPRRCLRCGLEAIYELRPRSYM